MAETSKNKIYYNDDENSVADVLTDMKKMAESTDKAIENSKYDDAQIKKDISYAKKEQALKDAEQDNKIIELQNEKAELEKELKEAQEDFYQNSIRGQASGEYIHVEDSSNCRAKIGISGNSEQETRSGKNKIDLAKCQIKTSNGVTSRYNKENNSITFNGTCTGNNTLFNIYIDNINATKNATTLTVKWISGTVSGYAVARCYDEDWKQNVQVNLAQLNASNKISGITYNDVADVFSHFDFRFDNGTVLNNFTVQLMLTDTVDTEYEMYGASPSPDHRSEIKSVGSNVNIFDGEIEKGGINYQNGNVESATDRIRSKNFIEVDPNFQYTINRLDSNGKGLGIRGYDKDKNYVGYIGVNTNKKITFIPQTYSNTDMPHPNTKFYYMKFIDLDNNLNARYKIEKGTVATPYSKYGQGSVKVTKYNKNIFKETYNRKDATSAFASIVKGECFLEKDKTYVVSFDTTNNGGTVYLGEDFFQYINAYTVKCDGTRKFFTVKAKKFGYVTDITVLKTRVDTTNAYNISNVMISEYENDTDTDYAQHEEQSYIMPVQQEMLVNDYLDYDNEEEVHVWGKKILTGDEGWRMPSSNDTNAVFTNLSNIDFCDFKSDTAIQYCNYFKHKGIAQGFASALNKGVGIYSFYSVNKYEYFVAPKTIASSVDEWKALLKSQYDAGTPVVVYYQLATPKRLKFTDEQKAVAKELNNARTYKNVTNITTDSKAILSLNYAKDLETLLNNTQALAVNNASEGV